MSLTIEEKIIRLRRGIASSETTPELKAIMEQDLQELLNPAPEVKQEPIKKAVAKKPVKKKEVKKEEPIKVEEVKAPELTEEDKKRLKEEIQRNIAKKKAKQAEEN